jgi:hypothetical protein
MSAARAPHGAHGAQARGELRQITLFGVRLVDSQQTKTGAQSGGSVGALPGLGRHSASS